ncbi:MAG: glycoside hydrolase family 32 protein [Selenomonadaceae bacterium]|nr:glycoside hydrolase family 32 protein [Selenomonadaceae bacterium]
MEHFDKKAIDLKVKESLPFNHHWHNYFHLEMPFGLINDPNGLTKLGDTYHIFFQWNPLGVVHKNKCWAHTTTKDFINYTTPELALWPTDVHDKDGCYSGCGLVENNSVRVLYTCNSKDPNNIRTSAQRFGTLISDGHVEKDEIIVPDNPEGYTAHFRDPNLFVKKGVRYFVIGVQRKNETGTALIYREDGENQWTNLGELKTDYKDFGYMWECPGLVNFGDYEALIFSPQGLEAEAFQYQNIFQAGYIAGRLSLDSMEMMHGKFQELDKGFDFYAPQVFNDQNDERRILLGWMGMPDKDDEYPTGDLGWKFSLTMPRVLTLKQGHIFSQPAEELQALRKTSIDINKDNADSIKTPLSAASEAIIKIKLGKAKKITFTLNYGDESTDIYYDKTLQTVTIDRSAMKLGGRGRRTFKLYADDTLNLQLFVDRTAIEAFFQDGEEAASFFVFPQNDVKPELIVSGDALMDKVNATIYELGQFNFE